MIERENESFFSSGDNNDLNNFHCKSNSDKGKVVLQECSLYLRVFVRIKAVSDHYREKQPGVRGFKCDQCDKDFLHYFS